MSLIRHGAEPGGNRLVTLPGRVLVARGGLGAGVTHPRHKLSGAGTGRRSKRIARVAKVVEMEVRHPDLDPGLVPGSLEDRPPQGASLGPPEEPSVPAGFGVLGKVHDEFLPHEVRQADDATTHIALRWTNEVAAPLQLLELLDDHYRTRFKVNPLPGQCEYLAHTQTAEGRQKNGYSIRPIDGIAQREDLLEGRDRTLRTLGHSRTLDIAGVLRDDAVPDRSREDRAKQSIVFCTARLSEPFVEQTRVPAADRDIRDFGSDAAHRRHGSDA